MSELTPADVVTLQSMVTFMAVEALIDAHPEPNKVRAVFDQLYSQIQTGPVLLGNPEAQDFCRVLVDKLFPAKP